MLLCFGRLWWQRCFMGPEFSWVGLSWWWEKIEWEEEGYLFPSVLFPSSSLFTWLPRIWGCRVCFENMILFALLYILGLGSSFMWFLDWMCCQDYLIWSILCLYNSWACVDPSGLALKYELCSQFLGFRSLDSWNWRDISLGSKKKLKWYFQRWDLFSLLFSIP